jgi:hypothetical protein
VRKALIVLAIVALVIVALGAVNHGLLFDIDFVAGTWAAVSLFWVAVVIAGVVFVSGVVAAFFARSGAVAARRKLETELQGTYERLRDAEAKLPRPAPVQTAVVDVAPGEQTAVTGAVPAPTTDETATVAEAIPEAETAVITGEAETAVVSAAPEAETVATTEVPAADVADASPPAAS